MKKRSLTQRLIDYFKARPDQHIASGDIQRLVTTKTTYTASNATRRLRELAEDGTLKVEYIKGHAYYWYESPKSKVVRRVEVINGVAKEIYETISCS